MVVKNLKTLKYQELQKLAKNAGIKANQKIDKLIKALEGHYIDSTDGGPVQTPPNATVGPKKASLPNVVNKFGTPNLQVQHSTSGGSSTSKSDTPDLAKASKQSKKRRRTFELDEPSLSPALTPTSDVPVRKRITRSGSRSNTPVENVPVAKRQRRNTYNKNESPAPASPETTKMIASIDANQDSAERKANLLSAINKKIQSKVTASPASPARSCSQPSQIPRFMAYLASMKKGAQQQKPVTPGNKDWTKIHGKEFSKFDSLDVYLDKKQKRKNLLTGSGKRTNPANPKAANSKIARPVTKPFVPTVTSVKSMNFNFGTTPSRQTSTSLAAPKFSARSASARPGTKATSTNRTTPFKFTGGNMAAKPTPASASKKNLFDLKASLARPLSWKPHVGKLQPLDVNTTGSVVSRPTPAAAATSTKTRPIQRPSRQAMAAKMRPTNVKDVRRVQQLDRRNNQKYIDMMRRRGLMA